MSTTTPAPEQPAGTAPDPLVGTLFADRYRIIRKLGEGAMGAVYVGEHQHIGRRDAIKVLRPGLAGDEEAIRRFTRGTRNVSAIRHPNVCTVYDFSDTPEGIRYLAMEYVEGDTLKQVLDREGRLELARAVEITRQVAEALQAAHDVGVVHRDLKPGNIMICRRPDGREQVKVVDFDIAKGPAEAEGDEVTRVGFVVGTPEYMSPEQLTGDRLDGRSDLYSLAVVLFRMLAGQLPFRAASTQELMIQRLTTDPLRLRDAAPDLLVPAALERALQQALARRAQDRQASAGEFGREVVAALATTVPAGAAGTAAAAAPPLPPTAAPAGAGPPELAPTRVAPAAGRAPGRKLSPALAGGLALVLVAIGAGATVFLRGRGHAGGEAGRPDSVMQSGPALPGGGTAQGQQRADLAARGDTAVQPAVAGAGSGPGQSETTSQPPTEPARPLASQGSTASRTVVPGGITAMLERQVAAVYGASRAQLRAVQDSGRLGWRNATNRADSAAAAFVLAQAAYASGDNAECLSWARRAAGLGEGAARTLVQECR